MDEDQPGEINEDGYLIDEYGKEIGSCNSCGEECEVGQECCEDGEIVPFDGEY